jgi:hypothetical protein
LYNWSEYSHSFFFQPTKASVFAPVPHGQQGVSISCETNVIVSSKNGKLKGREKGAFAYGLDEHISPTLW